MEFPYRQGPRSTTFPSSSSSDAVNSSPTPNSASASVSTSIPTTQADDPNSGDAPTLYLTGFSCMPSDAEYASARRATGDSMPYWFEESTRPPSYLDAQVGRRASLVTAGMGESVAVVRLDGDGDGDGDSGEGRGAVVEGRDTGTRWMGMDEWERMERVRERELLRGLDAEDKKSKKKREKKEKKEKKEAEKSEKERLKQDKKAEADANGDIKRRGEDGEQGQPRARMSLRIARRLARRHDGSSDAVEMNPRQQGMQDPGATEKQRRGQQEMNREHEQQAQRQLQQQQQPPNSPVSTFASIPDTPAALAPAPAATASLPRPISNAQAQDEQRNELNKSV